MQTKNSKRQTEGVTRVGSGDLLGHCSSIFTVVIMPAGKCVNGKSSPRLTIDRQFFNSSPGNIRINIYLDFAHGDASGLKILKHVFMMLQPYIVGGTHVAA